MTRATQVWAMIAITAITMITIMIMTHTKINCNDPQTWSTESGVRHCAINGGK